MATRQAGDASGWKPKTIQEQVLERLRQAILTGQFKMGERLTEKDLALRLGVSRIPVREALQRLTTEGLVDYIPRVGCAVHAPTADQIREIQETRGVLEGLAARKLALRIRTEPDTGWLRELEQDNAEMRQKFTEGDMVSYFARSRSFHVSLVELAGSETLRYFHVYIMNHAALFRLITGGMPDRQLQALREHEAVLEAIRRGEPDEADRAIRQHHENGMWAMLQALEARQQDLAGTGVNGNSPQ